jgi:polar amino acid transport system ATP-binding protein
MTDTLISIRDLHKSFGALEVLKGIDIDVARGERIAIIGSSGSGKSTLLRCVNFMEMPTSGTITIDGRTLGSPRKGNANQDAVRGRPSSEARERALVELAKVGLSDKAGAYPGKLSGGQQQRVAIARALAMDPEVLLFDEPTSALDPELVGEVLRVIRALAEEGRTMLLVTHEIGFAYHYADRVLFLAEGRIHEAGTPDEVLKTPREERTRSFLARFTEFGF